MAKEKSRFFWAAPSRGSIPWHSCRREGCIYTSHFEAKHVSVSSFSTSATLIKRRCPDVRLSDLWVAFGAHPLCFLSAQNQNQNLIRSEAHSITYCGRSGCQHRTFLPPWTSTDIVLMFPAVLLENYKMNQPDVPKETRIPSRWAGRIVSAAAVRRNQRLSFKLLKVVLELLFLDICVSASLCVLPQSENMPSFLVFFLLELILTS